MFFLRNSLFLVALLLVAVGCSSGDSDDVEAEESSAEEVADSDVDMEELEEEFGVTEGEDAEIPELLPADLYVTDDMEIEHTVVNERSEEHTSELQSRGHLVCRLLLEKKN